MLERLRDFAQRQRASLHDRDPGLAVADPATYEPASDDGGGYDASYDVIRAEDFLDVLDPDDRPGRVGAAEDPEVASEPAEEPDAQAADSTERQARPRKTFGALPAGGVTPAAASAMAAAASAPRQRSGTHRQFVQAGRPINRQSPFYLGFFGALGVLVACGLAVAVVSVGQVLTLLLVALFLTLALDPFVEVLMRRRVPRGFSVLIVSVAVVAIFVLLGLIVVPPVSAQAAQLVAEAPTFYSQVISNPSLRGFDDQYHVVARLQDELNQRLADSGFYADVIGGLFGAGRLIANGIFSALTVLVLTLYFLATLPALKRASYAMVPASRRPRVISLTEEALRRVGLYATSQLAVAAINAVCSFVMMTIVGVPYAGLLAVLVGFLGLVPMIGASLGAVLVAVAALFESPTKAIIVLSYFIVYQQLENYLVAPRIMRRTVAVPGAVTVVAALVGGTLLGAIGALIAIPTAAGLLLLYDEVLVPRQRRT